MELLFVSFVAGILTVAAPCILPLLPVIVGGSIVRSGQSSPKSRYRPLVIAGSLVLSVILFTLLLKATTALLGIPQMTWQIISGAIVLLFGINFLWPIIWQRLAVMTNFESRANRFLGQSSQNQSLFGDALIGFALGPVFNSCSPTYALIIAAILPASFAQGFTYLIAYSVGLAAALLVIAYVGQSAASKLGWLANPSGWFRRIVGVLFMLVGAAVIFGLDKDFQTFVLERGWYDPISGIEESLR